MGFFSSVKKAVKKVVPIAKVAIAPVSLVQDAITSTSIGKKFHDTADGITGGFLTNVRGAQGGDIASLVKVGQTVAGTGAFNTGGASQAVASNAGVNSMSFFDDLKKIGGNLDFSSAVSGLLGVNGNSPGSGTVPAEAYLRPVSAPVAQNSGGMDSKTMMMIGGGVGVLLLMMMMMMKRK